MQTLKTSPAAAFNRNLVKTFSACNATPGTGLAEAIKTSFADTAAALVLRNNGAAGLIRPRFVRLINTVVPASGTRSEARLALDTGVTRVSSGGTALTAKNRDMSSGVTTSNAVVTFGAVVTAAATAGVRYVSRFQLSTVIAVAFEEWMIKFGEPGGGQGAGSYGGTTATGRQIVVDAGPVVIGPGQEMILHTWHPSNAATPPSWEVEVCWEETKK